MALQQTAPRPEPEYSCPTSELYAGLDIVWNSQALHEAEFEAENTLYTPGLSVTRKAAIQAARIMPNGQVHGEVAQTKRITMVEKLEIILAKWHSLDGYILNAFPGEYYRPKSEAAGRQYYAKAANENWEYVSSLLTDMKNFLTAHSAALLADGGMPPTFIAGFDTVKGEFEVLFNDFKEAQQLSQEQTDAKIIANNAIYKAGRLMMEDGKKIFRKNASVRDRFIWERILSLLTPNTGSNSQVFEGDVTMGGIAEFNVIDVVATDDTVVIVEVSGNLLQFSSTPDPGPVAGPVTWTVAVGTQDKTPAEFTALVGASEINHYIKVSNGAGPGTGHYKVTFTNLA